MGIMDLERDYEYFTSIWNEKENSNRRHTKEAWNGRAASWGKELKRNESFQQSMDDRVSVSIKYLQEQGALEMGMEVIDIGCGPGRFVVEFAKTAAHVTGVDISEKMVELGREYAERCELDNVEFIAEDFSKTDIEKLGWQRKFDLVFTSITPAIGTMQDLEKAMEICKGYCFNSCYIKWVDELEEGIRNTIFEGKHGKNLNSHGKWFYSLFNILWIRGYCPKTQYYVKKKEECIRADEDLVEYYISCFSRHMAVTEEKAGQIRMYLEEHADSEGNIVRKSEQWYGWILWDVRSLMPRICQD